ncbi:MAG: phosphohydrolase [Clostridia bacterium]|nr:phosphohydrolase [Clostridia bacterium]
MQKSHSVSEDETVSYITTYSKKPLDPVTAKADEIKLVDIAHALSLMCRANGHFPYFYSVAQHCVNCVKEAAARGYSRRVQLGCLLHDASEAYLSDVTRPIKQLLPYYLEVEERLQNVIFDKWITPPLTEEERCLIFEVDDTLLYHEFMEIMGERVADTVPSLYVTLDFSCVDFSLVEKQYTQLFEKLTGDKTS